MPLARKQRHALPDPRHERALDYRQKRFRGLHSQGRPVLKQAVFQWLREGPCAGFVLAAVPRNDSGGGASMVLLRRKAGR